MYNKLFSKILDSSIWMESDTTRLVWLTFLAAMDETGYAHFSSVANLAHRARVELEACQKAVSVLEGPDPESEDTSYEGRRVERVPGGWMILNAKKYQDIVTRHESLRLNRERVQRHRAKKRGNASVMIANENVMQSDTDTDTENVKYTNTGKTKKTEELAETARKVREEWGR